MSDALTAELVEASRRVLDAELPAARGMDPAPLLQRWKELRPHLEELGWFDLLRDVASGGLGLAPAVATRLLRLAGSHLVPGPVVEAVLTVPWLLARPGARLGVLAEPGVTVATVDPCRDLPGPGQHLALHDGRLLGSTRCVLGAGDADVLLIHVLEGNAEGLVVLPATHPGLRLDPLRGADPCQSVAHVGFDCAVDDELVIRSADLPLMMRAWTRLGQAAYLAGIAERVVTMGVEHAVQRHQFGRPIGSFQAVQHLLADVAVIAQSLSNLVDFATHELTVMDEDLDEDEAVLTAAAAKARAGAEAVLACETVLQVLGGIGFTVEHPLHHYFKRALSLTARHGSPMELSLLAGNMVLARAGSGGRHGVVRVP